MLTPNVTLATAARATQIERRTVVDSLQSRFATRAQLWCAAIEKSESSSQLVAPSHSCIVPPLLTWRVREVGCLPELRPGGTMAPPPLWQHACCCAHLRRCCDAARLVSVGCILRSAAHEVLPATPATSLCVSALPPPFLHSIGDPHCTFMAVLPLGHKGHTARLCKYS